MPVVVLEEQLRGWLAVIHQATDLGRQVEAYRRLAGLFEFFADWEIVCFDAAAVEVYQRLKRERIRVGTMDLRIAAIALAWIFRNRMTAFYGEVRRQPLGLKSG